MVDDKHYRVLTNNNPHGGGFTNRCGICHERWPCQTEVARRDIEAAERRRARAHRDLMRREESWQCRPGE